MGFIISGQATGSVTTTVPGDSNAQNTTLLLSGNGSNNASNNTFVDSSTNNFAITRAGNTTQGTFSPYGPNWSNYFDGTGDYLSVPTNSAFDITTTQFTVECWIYRTASGVEQYLWSNRTDGPATGWEWRINSTNLMQFFFTAGSSLTSTGTIPVNTWTHLAVSRESNTVRFFINGALDSTATFANGTNATGIGLYLGYGTTGGGYFSGYMSNARLIKGTSLYTSAFTPSTTPLTAITNTSLLTSQSNRFKDNSTNNFAITRNGDVAVQRFSPFEPTAAYSTSTTGGSGYFDGTGDYLTAPNNAALDVSSGDFTVECWFYISALPAAINPIIVRFSGNALGRTDLQYLIFYTPSGSLSINPYSASANNDIVFTSVSLNTWHHCALVRSGNSYYAYLDGNRNATTRTISGSLNTGSWLTYVGGYTEGGTTYYNNGYVSDIRVVKGTAVYTGATYTVPTTPLTAITNTSLLLNYTNGGITDSAMINNLETVGNAQISTVQSKFGGSSMFFDGTGDYLFIKQDNPSQRFGTAPFTLECWIYLTSTTTSQHFFMKGSSGAGGIFFTRSAGNAGKLAWYVGGTEIVTTSSALSLNQWTHIAYVRTSTSASGAKIYINGVSSGTGTDSTNYTNTDSTAIGAEYAGTNPMTGYIDDYRITNGYARYTANFTPPTAALTAAGTVTTTTTGAIASGMTMSGTGSGMVISSYVAPSVTPTVEYLVVAGGGGGGGRYQSGGAGAGGVLTATGFAVASGTPITVTVGDGGAGGAPGASDAAGSNGTQGGNSVFGTITAIGGGYSVANTSAPGNGGSGGGNTPYNSTAPGKGVYPGSTYISAPRQGYDGGAGMAAVGGVWRGGGGGGAGGPGQPGSVQTNQGGIGILSSISGTSTGYGGGGGAASYGGNGGTAYTGYGGGNGGSDTVNSTTSGTPNTGGGGGGTERAGNGYGGSGGSGIVIIRYPDSYPAATATTGSPNITVTGGYRIYKWTTVGSGSITF